MGNVIVYNSGKTSKNNSEKKLNIRNVSPQEKFIIVGAGALAVTSLISAAFYMSNKETPDEIPPFSYESFAENTDEYIVSEETLQKFAELETQLKIYEKLSKNPEGLTYVEKQQLASSEEFIKSNYDLLMSVYLYQTKSKVAEAYGLPKEKVTEIKTDRALLYTTITGDFPTITDQPVAYFEKLIGKNSNVIIPKELEAAITDVALLQFNRDYTCDEILEKYNNFLKFLSFEFVADEKGNIYESDADYTPTAEDIVEFYSPTYESLKAKKEANHGKLKKSQQIHLEKVIRKMNGSLLTLVYDRINELETTNPTLAQTYRDKLVYILTPISEDSIVSPHDVFPTLFNMNSELKEELNPKTFDQMVQEEDNER